MKKQTSHAFGKDCYLLGRNQYNELIWMESARWDCGWYWGMGYIKVYDNQANPAGARDVRLHSHYSGLTGAGTGVDGAYTHHINEVLPESVLTDKEAYKLADYMHSIYSLKSAAKVLGRGTSHISGEVDKVCLNKELAKNINEVQLPALFVCVYELLTP